MIVIGKKFFNENGLAAVPGAASRAALGASGDSARSKSDSKIQKAGEPLFAKEGLVQANSQARSEHASRRFFKRRALYGAIALLGIGAVALAAQRTNVFASNPPPPSVPPQAPLKPTVHSSNPPSQPPNDLCGISGSVSPSFNVSSSNVPESLFSASSPIMNITFNPGTIPASSTVLRGGENFLSGQPIRHFSFHSEIPQNINCFGSIVGLIGTISAVAAARFSDRPYLPALAISLVSSGLVIALFNQSGESLKESAVHYSSVAQDVMSRFVGHLKDASLGSLAVVRDIVVLTPRFVKYVMTSPNVWAAGLGVLGFWGLTYAF